jgi:hypothetical protein
MTIRVRCEVTVVEVDGKVVDTNAKDKPVLIIEANWRPPGGANNLVDLSIAGHKYTVQGLDIETAVKNARNR